VDIVLLDLSDKFSANKIIINNVNKPNKNVLKEKNEYLINKDFFF